MFSDSIQMPSITAIISTLASIAGSTMVIHSIINKYMSPELQDYIYSKLGAFISSFFSQTTLVIAEFDGLEQNQLFKAADMYLRTTDHSDTEMLKLVLAPKQSNISFRLVKYEETIDTFEGVAYKWKLDSEETRSTRHENNYGHRCFKLRFHKKYKERAIHNYLPHVLSRWRAVEEEKKTSKLFTLKSNGMGFEDSKPWVSVELDHPATFDTLAMDTELKRTIINDLERFVKRKAFYKKVGKAWKRGYLLFGPPGTGKSSLIAAMANYLNFDIYDLELTDIMTNSQLRTLLLSTENRSILVVEDIDCSIELQERTKVPRAIDPYEMNRRSQLTLSGLLNVIDGLWSSCGDERIIVFTTNHKERLDPALLRPGRMDVHIHMSYCTPCGFKMLASNYLGIARHPLFLEVEQLIESTKVTPAEIGEQLLGEEEAEIALRGLIEFLQGKKESDEIKASEIVAGPSEAEDSQEIKGKNVESQKLWGKKQETEIQ